MKEHQLINVKQTNIAVILYNVQQAAVWSYDMVYI